MGKDLNGKELGKGIIQEKNGKYVARFTDKQGKRRSKRFNKWQECRQWMADATYADEHCNSAFPHDIVLNAWFDYWMENKKRSIKPSTARSYEDVYNNHIRKQISTMLLTNIRPFHCQEVLNIMADDELKSSTINRSKRILILILESAFQNDIIPCNPCKKGVNSNIGKPSPSREALTVEEQNLFLKETENNVYADQYRFILQTGIRIGELTGLRWEDVDFANRTIHIQRSVGYNSKTSQWDISATKTKAGNRTIPLTSEAIEILKRQKVKHSLLRVIPFEWMENVFLTANGNPSHKSAYNTNLEHVCERIGLKHISVHILRHTFATRCIEGGMKPKTLQKILGHANVTTTLNLYVHTTDEEKRKEIDLVEGLLGII